MSALLEAAQQALEALEAIDEDPYATHSFPALSNDAITALRAALAQQGQEPVAWKDRTYGNLHHQDFGNSIPLYTHPPRREWQGLTEEEVWSQYQTLWPFHPAEEPRLAADISKFARAIEAALKERNT